VYERGKKKLLDGNKVAFKGQTKFIYFMSNFVFIIMLCVCRMGNLDSHGIWNVNMLELNCLNL